MSKKIAATRRTVVAAGLGFAAFAPMAALADMVTKVGYKADGPALRGPGHDRGQDLPL